MDWLNALQAVLFVAVLVTSAWIGLQQGTIRTLRASNDDLRARRDDLEKDRAELSKDLDDERKANAQKVADLETAVRILSETVTAKDAIADLASRLDLHHLESMSVLTDIKTALTPSGG
jgi:uncharacterized protein YlxW (UPF0749 family)